MTVANGIWALIPAGGQGLRMLASTPKQYHPILGRPVLLHTLERLCAHPRIRGVLVGVSEHDHHWQAFIPILVRLPKYLGKYTGGETRAHTVLNGLKELAKHAKPDDWVMVHDAVRPCVRHADLDKLIAAVGADEEGGLLALPVSDTVKRADMEGRIIATVERAGLWRAATPQMFRIGKLRNALEAGLKHGDKITDEASAVEAAGGHPRVVACHGDNIKITVAEDLYLAELILKQQQGNA